MATNKEISKNQSSKRNVPQPSGAKNKGTKVVEIRLKSSAKKTAQRAGTKSKSASPKIARSFGSNKKSVASRKPQTASAKKIPVKSKTAKALSPALAKKITAKKGRIGPASLAQSVTKSVEQTPEVPVHLTTPTPAMLKTFRKAVDRSRKLAKQMAGAKNRGAAFLAKPLKNGKKYTIDLRIHSPGSTGYFSTGGVDPGPALVRLAKVKGLDMIAVTDYYNASFVDPILELAQKTELTILPGVDLCCAIGDCREVYITTLFPETVTGSEIFALLSELGVPSEAHGRKEYCVTVPFGDVLRAIESRGGLVIPSRVDKTPYRQLAIAPLVEQYGIHTFDLVHPENTEYFRERWPDGQFTFLSFSNANALAQIGSRVAKVKLANPGFAGIKEIAQRRQPEASA